MAAPRDLEDALAVLSMKLRNASCAAFVLGESIEILGRSPSGAAFFLSTVLGEVADQVLELEGEFMPTDGIERRDARTTRP